MSDHHKFPLYDTLTQKFNQKLKLGNFSVNSEYRKRLHHILNLATPDQYEQIVVILIHYYMITNPGLTEEQVKEEFISGKNKSRKTYDGELPYKLDISGSGKGMSIEIDSIPAQVCAILGSYCE